MTQANQPVAQQGRPGLVDWLLGVARRFHNWLPFPLPEILAGAVILTILTLIVVAAAD
jgi:hypothetical protein